MLMLLLLLLLRLTIVASNMRIMMHEGYHTSRKIPARSSQSKLPHRHTAAIDMLDRLKMKSKF